MAELPKAHFRPERAGNNSVTSPFFPSLNCNENPNGVQDVGMCQPNSQHFVQTFAPHGCSAPSVQRGDYSGVEMISSGGHGSNIPSYLQYSQWSPSWNSPGVSNCQPGVIHGGIYPAGGPAAVIPFDASVPPPLPRITVQPPHQQCVRSQVSEVGQDLARKFDGSGSLMENDRMWIDSWCQHRQNTEVIQPSSVVTRNKKNLKVWEVKQLLQSCMSLLGELERVEQQLRVGCGEMSEAEWDWKLREAETKKVMLNKCLGVLDEGVVWSVRSVLVKRRRKRARLRGRRILEEELAAVRSEKRKKLHLQVDMWLERKQAEVDLHKREEMMKQEADAVLWEVRRKQSEGRKILSLLSALVKLHHVRVKKNDSASNPAPPENEDQFQIIIDKLSSLWERQMSEYDAEERALRVMLKDSPEDGGPGGVGGSKDRHKATGDLQRSLRLWESLLFGTGAASPELLSLRTESCQWLYLQPSRSLDALIENRMEKFHPVMA
ncbi:programmed cell death protein 7-like isoform X2 [Hetaerina americana]|uniref:programmed cell death protein 7-like isoform X2 n=1 Tax=Hetaerina americana TaxID=62018 RepID=UPI003A7F5F4B